MTCRELIESLLGEYADRTLPGEVRAAVERHVAACDPCARYVRSYLDTIAAARRAEAAVPDAEAPADLVASILAAARRRP